MQGSGLDQEEERKFLAQQQAKSQAANPQAQQQQQRPVLTNNSLGQAAQAVSKFITENVGIPAADFVDNTFQGNKYTPDQIADQINKAQKASDKQFRAQKAQRSAEFKKNNPALAEVSNVLEGGALSAAESFVDFGRVAGESVQSGAARLFPKLTGPLNPERDPFSGKYQRISEDLGSSAAAETPLGKVAQGFLGFGITLSLTGGLGGGSGVLGATRAIRAGEGVTGAARAFGASGAARGAFADLIYKPEDGNLSNLIKENAPEWYPTWLTALAVEDGENPWLSRLKTGLEGALVSEVGDLVFDTVKAVNISRKALKSGVDKEKAIDLGIESLVGKIREGTPRITYGDVARRPENQQYFTLGEQQVEDLKQIDFITSLQKGQIKEFTVNPVNGQIPESGFLVAIDGAQPLADFSPKAIDDFLSDNVEALSREDAFLRGKTDPVSGKPYVELVRLINDPEEASRLGREFDQEAITQLGVGDIPVGGQNRLAVTRDSGFNDLNYRVLEDRSLYEGADSRTAKVRIEDAAAEQSAKGASSDFTPPSGNRQILTPSAVRLIGLDERGQQVIDEVIRSSPDLKDIARRSGRTVKEIRDEAANLVADFNGDPSSLPSFKDMRGTEILSDSGIVASKTLIQDLSTRLADSAYALTKVNEAGMDVMPQVTVLVEQMKGLLAAHKYTSQHYGRGLATFKIPSLGIELPNPFRKDSIEDINKNIRDVNQTFDRLIKDLASGDMEAKQKAVNLANAIMLAGGDPSKIIKMRNWVGEIMSREALGILYNSWLSGPATQVVNTLSSVFNTIYRPTSAAAGSFFTKDGFVTRKAVAASFASFNHTLKESWDVAALVFRNGGQGINDGNKGLIRVSETEEKLKLLRLSADRSNDESFKFGVGMLETFHAISNNPLISYPSMFMTTTDEFFKTMVARMEWRSKSYMQAVQAAEGRTDQIESIFKNLLDENEKKWFVQEGKNKGAINDDDLLASSKDVTFQNELEGAARRFGSLVDSIPPLKIFFPFVKTGHNILAYAFSHLPVLGTKLPEFQKALDSGDPYQIAVMKGRQAFGSLLVGTAGVAAFTGNLTGNGPSDPQEKQIWLQNNYPRSIKIPGTNKWLDYSRIEPFNMILGAVADVYYGLASGQLRERDAEYLMGHLTYTIAMNLTNRSYFAGLTPLGQILTPGYQGLGQLAKIPAALVNSFIPWSGARRQIANAMNPYMREFSDELERLAYQATAGTNKLESAIRYDWLSGKPIQSPSGGGNAIWPYAVRDRKLDPVRDELENIGFESSNIVKRLGVELTPSMISKIQKHMGESDLYNSLKNLMQTEAYKASKAEAKADLDTHNFSGKRRYYFYDQIEKRVDDARNKAIAFLYATDPEFRTEAQNDKTDRIRTLGFPQPKFDQPTPLLDALLEFNN